MKGKYLIISTAVLAIAALLIVIFFDDIRDVVFAADDVSNIDTATDTTTDAEREYIFMTYSTLKTNDYFFAYNCYEKANEAVESGKYESVKDYVYDTDFDHDALTKAKAAVEAGEVSSELEYMQNHEDAGKMAFLLHYDPMYAAAWACYIDQSGLTGDSKILYAEQELPVPQQPDAAIQRFIDNSQEWDEAIVRIESYLWAKDAEASIDELDNYTSGMYAVKDGITDGIPAVIVANTQNAGGHFIIITVNGVSLRFRLECGYQPIEIPNWTPQITTIPDNPKKYVKDPKDDPLNNPDAPESDAWAPDPTNYNPDKTETEDPNPEVNNPDELVTPEPPTEEPTTEAPDTDGKTVDPQDETGSDADDDNGKTTTTKDDKDAEIVAGDGEDHQNFNDVNKDPNQQNTTEEKFDDHTTYDPDLEAPE